ERDVLPTLVERYEDVHEPVPPPDPLDAGLFRLEKSGRSTHDIRELLGVRRHSGSAILNRKHRLSLDIIRRLSEELDIPAEVLIQTEAEPDTDKAPPPQTRGRRRGQRPKGGGGAGSRRGPAAERSPSVRSKREAHDLPDIVDAHLRAERD